MTTADDGIPKPIRATSADLPPAVARAMDAAHPSLAGATRRTVDSGGIAWAMAEWGDRRHPPVVLVHGVVSNAETFWHVAPAIAASGRHVVAVDLPGHGRTGTWQGRHRFLDTASDVAAFIQAADLERPGLAVLGHSWGGMVVANLPSAGLSADRLILLDPPALPVAAMELMTHDPLERHFDVLTEAVAVIRSARPGWSNGDIEAKALGLTQFNEGAALAILLQNGDWDGGLRALLSPPASTVRVWLIRGEFPSGGLVPDQVLSAFADRIGADHVITIADAPHSPQRQYPEATVLAILRALEG